MIHRRVVANPSSSIASMVVLTNQCILQASVGFVFYSRRAARQETLIIIRYNISSSLKFE